MMTSSAGLHTLQWVLLAFFLIPFAEVIMGLLGAAWAQLGYAKAPGKFKHLVIQITTVGKEPELVQRTIDTIRGYGLTMSYELWVAIEPGHFEDYENADRVIVVPKSFKCLPIDKARALEYTRRLRVRFGLNRPDVKILLVDDDTLPSKRYVELAFNGDYDLCQGPTVPNRWFGVGGWRHFVLSHMDNIRTRNCLIYCSCTQGVTQKPLFVHGEGLCITGEAEHIVTWNRRIVASDDLVFGTNAARLGLSWGYFHGGAIQLVSPWSFRENLNQRWRWTWGNFDAIANREIMPLGAAIFKGFKYALGFVSIIASTTGAVLLWTGVAKVPPQAHKIFWISLVCWVGSYALSGWINAGGQPNRELLAPRKLDPDAFKSVWSYRKARVGNWFRQVGVAFWWNRFFQTAVAALLTPITAIAPVFVISYSILRGRPTKFVMIRKSNQVMQQTA